MERDPPRLQPLEQACYLTLSCLWILFTLYDKLHDASKRIHKCNIYKLAANLRSPECRVRGGPKTSFSTISSANRAASQYRTLILKLGFARWERCTDQTLHRQ